MNKNKKSCICAALHNHASEIIEHAGLWRHYEQSEAWARKMLIDDLRYLVAAAAFLGITTKNVKYEMKSFVTWFNKEKSKE